MLNYYTYYTYEPFGRGYIGSRQCECSPSEDRYMGSYRDKTFSPTEKIILGEYQSREEANAAEILLHEFYQVDVNPHFANQSRSTSTGFIYCGDRRGSNNIQYGKIRITNGTDETTCYPSEIPDGWRRGRSDRTKRLSSNGGRGGSPRGEMYNTFVSDFQADATILNTPIRELGIKYKTSHTSIIRWKKSLVVHRYGDARA